MRGGAQRGALAARGRALAPVVEGAPGWSSARHLAAHGIDACTGARRGASVAGVAAAVSVRIFLPRVSAGRAVVGSILGSVAVQIVPGALSRVGRRKAGVGSLGPGPSDLRND